MGCLECGKELVQIIGKRAKKFCNVTCRSNYWQKQKRNAEGLVFRKAGRPKKNTPDPPPPTEEILAAFISPKQDAFDAPLIDTIQDEPNYFVPVNQAVIDKLGKVLVEAKKTPQRAASQSTESFMGHPIPKGLKGIELSIWKAEIKEKSK